MRYPVQYLTIDGLRLAYREAGSGPAMFLMHGLGGNSASWEMQFAHFANAHRVVAWDMPGFGDSEVFAMPDPTTHHYAKLAAQLLDRLGIDRAIGFGTSYGTVMLADLALTHPSRISAMVFACGVTGLGHLPPDKRTQLRATRRAEIETLGQRRFAETRNSTYLGKGMPQSMIDRVVDLAGSATSQGYLQAYNAFTESNIFPLLAKLAVPTLVLAGAHDPIAAVGDCERVAAAIGDAEYHLIENAGHYVNLEQAETFNRLVDNFLAHVAPEPSVG